MTTRSQQVVERIKGPVVPLNVCFNEDGTVDYGAMRGYVDWLGRNGAPLLLFTYGSSEFACLTDQEIWRLTAEVAEANAGRALFVAATGYWKPSACREFLAHADKVGADAVKVQVHPGIPLEREVYLGYFRPDRWRLRYPPAASGRVAAGLAARRSWLPVPTL